MRSARLWKLALLLVAGPLASACGDDSLAPPDVAAEIGTRDLDVWVPPLTRTVGAVESKAIDWPADWTPGPEDGMVSIRGGGEPVDGSAYIGSTYLTSGWDGDMLWYEYGMMGMGTGYSMVPTVRILKPDGTTLLQETTSGIKLTLNPIPVSFTPSMREEIRTGIFCGLTANITVGYRSFIGIEFDAFPLALSASKTARTSSSQPGCPSPTGSGGTGGSGGGGGGYYITYCRYEAYFTAWGDLIAITFLGCTSVPLNAA